MIVKMDECRQNGGKTTEQGRGESQHVGVGFLVCPQRISMRPQVRHHHHFGT